MEKFNCTMRTDIGQWKTDIGEGKFTFYDGNRHWKI